MSKDYWAQPDTAAPPANPANRFAPTFAAARNQPTSRSLMYEIISPPVGFLSSVVVTNPEEARWQTTADSSSKVMMTGWPCLARLNPVVLDHATHSITG